MNENVNIKGKSNFIGIYPVDGCIGEFVDKSIVSAFINRVDMSPGFVKIRKDQITVELDNAEAAVICFRELNGKEMEYPVEPSSKKRRGTQTATVQVRIEIFQPYCARPKWIEMSPLDPAVTEKTLLNHLEKEGKIENLPRNIWLRPTDGRTPGWGLIECANYLDADKAVDCLNGKKWNAISLSMKTLSVCTVIERQICRHRELENDTTRVLFHRLHRLMKRKDLAKICSKFGTVTKCFVVMMGSAAIGGVEMSEEEHAKAVFDGLHGKVVGHLRIHTQFVHSMHPFYFQHFDGADYEAKRKGSKVQGSHAQIAKGIKKWSFQCKDFDKLTNMKVKKEEKRPKKEKKSRLKRKMKNKREWKWDKKHGVKIF